MELKDSQEETIRAYRLHSGAVLGYVHRLTRNQALAQDAVQESFLRLFLALMQGEEIRNVRAWLHRVAHNYVCETARSATVRTAVSLEDVVHAQGGLQHGVQDSESTIDWIETARQLLAPREWQCVQLRAEGFDYNEIAVELAIRPGTVGTLLHRAAQKLGIQLRKKGEPG
jgi:RNA polymerase sigma-70 factor (ECF subfamily)